MTATPAIPTLDIRRYDSDRDAFVAELGAAYREWGFCGIRGHGIPQSLIDGAYEVFKAFFALPDEVKRRYHVPGSGGARDRAPFAIVRWPWPVDLDAVRLVHAGRFEHGEYTIRDYDLTCLDADDAPLAKVSVRDNRQPVSTHPLACVGASALRLDFTVETAKDSRYPDLKEFWHVGRELPEGSPYADVMPDNLWPAEVPRFREFGYGLYQALDQLGSRVLCALALHIGLPEQYFADKTNNGNSILRPIHYPPITAPEVPNVRAGAHEDINFITLLVGASAAGLEVRSRQGDWVPFTADADTIVVNIGDMLQRLTNHVYPSTTHRVTNPPGEAARQPRYSTPFFLHPNPDFLIDVLPSCIDAEHPNRYPQAITAHDYLLERLREIKLI